LVYEGSEDILIRSNLSTLASLKDTAVTNNDSIILAGDTKVITKNDLKKAKKALKKG
jgi:hypothetical protein